MKQNRTTRKLVYFLPFLKLMFILFLIGCGNRPINLPNVDEIVRIEMASGRIPDIEEIEITNADDVEVIMTVLSSAILINNRGANNDFPFGDNVLRISPYIMFDGEEELSNRLFLYIDNESGNEYLWNSYIGVYKLSEENINGIRQLFEELLENQNDISFSCNISIKILYGGRNIYINRSPESK